MSRRTHTYALLEVSQSTYDDVAERIRVAYNNVTTDYDYYFDIDEGRPVITLGLIALVAENTPAPEAKGVRTELGASAEVELEDFIAGNFPNDFNGVEYNARKAAVETIPILTPCSPSKSE